MVDYNIAVPQPYDNSSDIANALRFRAQQQAEAENQLKTQAWLEDRAYTLQQRRAAAANAAAEKAKAAELADIYASNIGISPAVTGRQGVSYSGTDMSTDPYARAQNELLKRGYVSRAQDLAEFQNKLLAGQKTGAEMTKLGAETTGINTENIKKKVEARAAQLGEYGDAILRASSLPEVYALIDSHAGVLSELGIPPEQAKKNFVDAANQFGFSEALMRSSKGAMATQKHLTDIDLTNAQIGAQYGARAKDIALRDKAEWERQNPGFTIEDSAQGKVRVNKVTGEVTPLTLNGETLMPTDKRSVTNIENYEPANVAAQKEYMQNVAKTREALQSAPATLENIERAKDLIPEAKTFMGTGGEAYLTVSKFLNNRLGTNINLAGVKSAEELRSRLFMGVMDNLKKMDAQPTGRQQEALQEAIGQLDTDPNALPQILDILGNSLRTKVDIYNKDVSDAEARGVKFPYKPQVELPAQKVVGENTFPSEAAASQILKQRGAKPGDRVRVNIGGRTGTFVVE